MATNGMRKTRRLTTAAVLSALGVILLSLGAFVEVLDLSMAVLASLCVIFAVIELGGSYPYLVYAVISLLSLILLPHKTPALAFALFAGYYPILKAALERRLSRWVGFACKLALFLAVLAAVTLISLRLFTLDLSVPRRLLWWLFPLAIPFFAIYDLALTRLITFYVRRLRKKFKFLS